MGIFSRPSEELFDVEMRVMRVVYSCHSAWLVGIELRKNVQYEWRAQYDIEVVLETAIGPLTFKLMDSSSVSRAGKSPKAVTHNCSYGVPGTRREICERRL